MNLFDVIGGNEKLHEPHVTSVLAWLLDPQQTHGCGTLFLGRFLGLLDKTNFQNLGSGNLSLRKIESGSVQVLMEHEVNAIFDDGIEKKQFIDIVILLKNSENKTHVIAVENKIKSKSIVIEQPEMQVNGLLNCLDNNPELLTSSPEIELSYIYLTSKKSNDSRNAFGNLNKFGSKITYKAHLIWGDGEENNNIQSILTECLKEENEGLVNPMPYETKFIVKSLIMYISNDFSLPSISKNYVGQEWDIEINGLDELMSYCEKSTKPVFIGYTFKIDGKIKSFANVKKDKIKVGLDNLQKRHYHVTSSIEEKSLNKNRWPTAQCFFDWAETQGWKRKK